MAERASEPHDPRPQPAPATPETDWRPAAPSTMKEPGTQPEGNLARPTPAPGEPTLAATLPTQEYRGALPATTDEPSPPWPRCVPPLRPDAFDIPGYELLGVIGRGAMGVVYKARQKSPPRLVAVKMILSGEGAGPEERRRFAEEAAAVARLNHPHIVQIYQFGEQKEFPFFSLELVESGTLARELVARKEAGQPRTFPEVAGLVETLARAVHYAHGQGIVHRDLKPANVLLTADGSPKITDFGLAKKLDGQPTVLASAGPGRAGAIVGTPSYMAPEQATGGKVGAWTDVYALGAILYELLTGRPPFLGETVTDVIQQVADEQPRAPRRLNPRAPRDLETVCLKCLDKDPRRRYATARDLAEDLARFRDGKPPRHAPPRNFPERLGRWARHPALRKAALVAGLLAAVVLVLLALRLLRPDPARLVERADQARQQGLALEAFALYRAAEQQYESRLGGGADRPDERVKLGRVRLEKGNIYRALREWEAAAQEFARAQEDLGRLVEEHPDHRGARLALAEAYHRLGILHDARQEPEEALKSYEQGLAIRKGLCDNDPDNLSYRRDLARSYGYMGDTQLGLNRVSAARQSYAQAEAIRQELVRRQDSDPEDQLQLARSLGNTANLLRWTGQYQEALRAYQQQLAQLRRATARFDTPPEFGTDLADARLDVAELRLDTRDSPTEETLELLLESRLAYRELLARSREDKSLQSGLARCQVDLAKYFAGKNRDRAVHYLGRAEDTLKELTRQEPALCRDLINLALVYCLRARLADPSQRKPHVRHAVSRVWRAVDDLRYNDVNRLKNDMAFRWLGAENRWFSDFVADLEKERGRR